MARACTICSHPEIDEINENMVLHKLSNRRIATQYGVSESAARRHKAKHLPATLAQAEQAKEVVQADSLLTQLTDLQERTVRILDQAEEARKYHSAFVGIGQARQNLELLGRL